MKDQAPTGHRGSGDSKRSPMGPARTRHVRALAPLMAVFLSAGLSTAIAAPFLTLFLTSTVHASPVRLSLFLLAQPVCGIAASTLMGRLSDRRFPRRHMLMLAAFGGAAGCASFAVVRNYWLLLALGCTVFAVGGALSAQGFAYARAILAGDPSAALATSTLRTCFSVAWVAGPPLASVLLTAGGFRWLYLTAAAFYAVVIAIGAFWLKEPPSITPAATDRTALHGHPPEVGRRTLWLTLAGIALVNSSLNVNVQAMALHVRHDLHGGAGAAGLILGLCAALEIPLMLSFGVLSTRMPLWHLVRLGPIFGVAYFLVAATATSVWELAAAQLLNACYIAIIAGLAISYVQELLPTQPGRASTLYSNARPFGAILASPVLGLGASYSYRLPYAAGIVLAGAGLILLTAGANSRRRSTPAVATEQIHTFI